MSDAWKYEYSIPIAAGVDALFAALTQEEELAQWFAEHASVDARKGGRMEFWGRHTVGTPKEGEAGGVHHRPRDRRAPGSGACASVT